MKYPEHHPLHVHIERHPRWARIYSEDLIFADRFNTKPATTLEQIREYNNLAQRLRVNPADLHLNTNEFFTSVQRERYVNLNSEIFYQPDELPGIFPELYQEGKEERR